MKRIALALVISVLFPQLLLSQESGDISLRLGTASPTGSYFRVGSQVKQLIERNVSNLSVDVITTGGSVDNLKRVIDGDLDLAIVQNDIAYMAEHGITQDIEVLSAFAGGSDSLRAVMTFYPEPIYVITSNLDYTRIGQLNGSTISIGQVGSGTSINAKTILEELDMWSDVTITYTDKSEIAHFFASDSIQAVFLNSFPGDVEQELRNGTLKLLSLPRNTISNLQQKYPYFASYRTEIHGQQVNTLAVKSMLVAHASLDASIVHRITEELDREWNYFSRFFPDHLPSYRRDDIVETHALRQWHEGAEAYYFSARLLRKPLSNRVMYTLLLPVGIVISWVLLNLFLWISKLNGANFLYRRSRVLTVIRSINTIVDRFKYWSIVILVIYAYMGGVALLEVVESNWAKREGVTNLFQNNRYDQNLLWLVVFTGSGYEGEIFPQSSWGRVIVSLIPLLGFSGLATIASFIFRDLYNKFLLAQKGMNTTHKKHHIIICGWNENVPKIASYLVHKNTSHDRPVVILAPLGERFSLSNQDLDIDRVEYINGSATNKKDLERANLAYADIALIVRDEPHVPKEEAAIIKEESLGVKKESAVNADAVNVLKVLTIEKFCLELEDKGKRGKDRRGGIKENIYTIAEIADEAYEKIARDAGVDEIISFREIQSKIMAQSALHRGVNNFINEILTFNEYNDIYIITLDKNSTLVGKNFDTMLGMLRDENILLLSIWVKKEAEEEIIRRHQQTIEELAYDFKNGEIGKKTFKKSIDKLLKEKEREAERNAQFISQNGHAKKLDPKRYRQVITNPINEKEENYKSEVGDRLIVLAQRESIVDRACKKLRDKKGYLQQKIEEVLS